MRNSRKLRVYVGRDDVLVPNYEGLDAKPPVRRFVGRFYDPKVGPGGGWPAKDEPETLNPSTKAHLDEYLGALRRGELRPADQETADMAGVPFEKKPSKK